MSVYHRTQILLEPEQHAALTEIAANEKRSVSEIMREMATQFLAQRNEQQKRKEALLWLENSAAFRKEMAERNQGRFLDPVTAIRDMYEEEDEEWERIVRGDE